MARKRRQPKGAEKPKAKAKASHPFLRLLTADIMLRLGGHVLRRAVRKGVVSGRAAEAVPDHPSSGTKRVAAAMVSAVASRSVPGAVLVGTGLVARALYRRGKARRAERLSHTPGAGGTLPPQ